VNQKTEEGKLSKIDFWSQKTAKDCDSSVNSLLATYFESQQSFDQAFFHISLALEKDPQNRILYEKMVWIAHQVEKLEQAKELTQSALSSEPGNHILWRCSGLIHLLKEDYPLAIKDLQESLKLKEDERITHFLLGCSFLALCEKNRSSFDSEYEPFNSAQDAFEKASEMVFLKEDPDFGEGKRLLDEKLFLKSLEKMRLVLNRARELRVEPASFSSLALSFLMNEKEVDQNQVESVISDLKKRSEQGKEYPEINNHLGLCFLIFWRSLLFEARNQLRSAIKRDAKFQNAKTNLMFLESTERKISTLIEELKF
jgi:tetratricopeptide (TPR) repeat protein